MEIKKLLNFLMLHLIIAAIWNLTIYLMITMVELKYSPIEWSRDARFVFAVFGVGLGSFISCLITSDLMYKDD